MKAGELVEGGWGKDELSTIVEMGAFCSGQHDGWVASVVLVEAASHWPTVGGKGVGVVHVVGVVGVELVVRLDIEVSEILVVVLLKRRDG